MDEAILHRLGALLHDRAGLSAALVQGPSFASAVKMRMSSLGIISAQEYGALAERDTAELVRLASEISVPETWLFRYPASFEFLRERFASLLPGASKPLVVASIGCANGVEAWCVAATAFAAGWDPACVIVHAIDRNEAVLKNVHSSVAPRGSVRSEFPLWAAPWIRKDGDLAAIAPEVTQAIQVTRMDALVDAPPFNEPLDAVLCRNVMIYLDGQQRAALRTRLLEWAGDEGVILLGHADGLHEVALLESMGPVSAFAWRKARAPLRATPMALVAPKPIGTRPSAPPKRNPVTPRPSTPAATSAARSGLTLSVERVRELVNRHDLEGARKAATDALAVAPTNPELIELLAGIHAALDQREESLKLYQRLVYLQPSHGPALLALAELSAALGRQDDAERYRLRAKRLMDA